MGASARSPGRAIPARRRPPRWTRGGRPHMLRAHRPLGAQARRAGIGLLPSSHHPPARSRGRRIR
eukprot:9698431-Heterocapsa_arctica.AAC.1